MRGTDCGENQREAPRRVSVWLVAVGWVRKVNPGSNRTCEVTSSTVPATDKQGEEDLWQCYKTKHGVWSEGMLEALERGVKGGK